MNFKYSGEDFVYADPLTGQSVLIENDKVYDIVPKYDGPQMIVNGMAVYHPDATIWAVVDDGRVNIPYAPERFHVYWKEL